MCGICITAASVSVVFLCFIGIFLASLTDKKVGLPLGLLAAMLAGSQLRVLMLAPKGWLTVILVLMAVRGSYVILTNDRHWVHAVRLRIEGWVIRLVRPIFRRLKGSKA